MVKSTTLDHAFVEEVLTEPGGENLLTCWSCGTCAATCLVRRYKPAFNPRRVLRQAGMGQRDEVLASPEIWQCSACDACYPRCPKKIHISEVMRAIRNIAIRRGYERPGVVAKVNIAQCTACGMCAAACPYKAIALETVKWNRGTRRAARIDASLCMSCGICNGVCPSSSISVESHTDAYFYKSTVNALHSVRAWGDVQWHGKILAIVCDWCLHSESDVKYAACPPEGVAVISVPCSGRVPPTAIMTALQGGANAVLVVGCKEDQCHYKHGNMLEKRRLVALRALLDLMGIERVRVQFAQLGSLDRGKLPRLVHEVAQDLQAPKDVAGVLPLHSSEKAPHVVPFGLGSPNI